MKIEEFNDMLSKLNLSCNEEQYNKLIIYKEFLKEYNSHTNITAIKEDKDIFIKHFYDSLTICEAEDFNNINTVLDVGSGAGFPGVVLKIFFSKINMYLLDSNNKKTTFLKELIKKLEISNTYVINQRVEDYAKENINSFDIVTARAVANLRVLSELTLPLVKKDGFMIALKGQTDEISDAINTIDKMHGKIIDSRKLMLPYNEGERTIIKIQKISNSNLKELRPYSKIIKSELK